MLKYTSFAQQQQQQQQPTFCFAQSCAGIIACSASATPSTLSLPRVYRSAFSVAGPTVSNSLSDDLRDPAVDSTHFSET